MTGTGSANTLNGESSLQFDGTNLTLADGDFLYTGGGNFDIKHNTASANIVFSTTPSGGSATARMRITHDGNVGIGTDSPLRALQVGTHGTGNGEIALGSATNGVGSILFGDGASGVDVYRGYVQYNHTADALLLATAAAARMRIDSSGRVGINRTPAISNSKLEVGGADNVPLINVEASGVTGGMGIGSTGLQFFHGSTARMRIDSSGSLGLGTANPGSLFHVAHSNGGANPTARIENTTGTVATNSVLLDLKFSGDDSFSNCDYLRFQDSSGEEGVITGDGGGRVYYEINSDYRLKENVLDYSGGLNKIKALSVKRYNYKTRPGTTYTGFLAHEVAEVVDGVARGTKDAVNPDGTPDYQGMDLSKLVPELVSAIQEQQTIIDDLKSRIETLEE